MVLEVRSKISTLLPKASGPFPPFPPRSLSIEMDLPRNCSMAEYPWLFTLDGIMLIFDTQKFTKEDSNTKGNSLCQTEHARITPLSSRIFTSMSAEWVDLEWMVTLHPKRSRSDLSAPTAPSPSHVISITLNPSECTVDTCLSIAFFTSLVDLVAR